MITINIAGFLTDFTAGRSQITLDGSPATVGEAFHQLWGLHRGLRDRVVNEQGHVRPHVNIFLNGENIRRKEALGTALAGDAEITILPSVSGGQDEGHGSEREREGSMKVTWPEAILAESGRSITKNSKKKTDEGFDLPPAA